MYRTFRTKHVLCMLHAAHYMCLEFILLARLLKSSTSAFLSLSPISLFICVSRRQNILSQSHDRPCRLFIRLKLSSICGADSVFTPTQIFIMFLGFAFCSRGPLWDFAGPARWIAKLTRTSLKQDAR